MYVYLYLYACKMYIHGYRAACLACMCTCESLSLSQKDALLYTSASAREASQGHAARVETMTPTDYDTYRL